MSILSDPYGSLKKGGRASPSVHHVSAQMVQECLQLDVLLVAFLHSFGYCHLSTDPSTMHLLDSDPHYCPMPDYYTGYHDHGNVDPAHLPGKAAQQQDPQEHGQDIL